MANRAEVIHLLESIGFREVLDSEMAVTENDLKHAYENDPSLCAPYVAFLDSKKEIAEESYELIITQYEECLSSKECIELTRFIESSLFKKWTSFSDQLDTALSTFLSEKYQELGFNLVYSVEDEDTMEGIPVTLN